MPPIPETESERRARLAELLNVLQQAKRETPSLNTMGFLTLQSAIIRLEVELNWREPEERKK